jgi:DNA polymerase-3 subunit alpha
MNPSFVHLRIHSDFSLVDSTIRLPEKPEYGDPARASYPNLISHAVTLDMPALALTDQSNLFALVKFYRAAEANGIKPIAGADLWVGNPAEPGAPTQLTLLCQNRRGYLNSRPVLSRATSKGAMAILRSSTRLVCRSLRRIDCSGRRAAKSAGCCSPAG